MPPRCEKEEHGSLDIETIRNIDVPSYVAGRSYSHLGEIAKYRKRALDQIIRYIGYLEQIHAPAELAAAEWYDEFRSYTVPGRMVCDEDFKYICYLEPDSEELYDRKQDRYEKTNLARRPEYAEVLEQYRGHLKKHLHASQDPWKMAQAMASG